MSIGGESGIRRGDTRPVLAFERHYTVREIADMWNLDPSTVRRVFQDRPGVFKIPHVGRRTKRDYTSLRIPESVVIAVHAERSR